MKEGRNTKRAQADGVGAYPNIRTQQDNKWVRGKRRGERGDQDEHLYIDMTINVVTNINVDMDMNMDMNIER